MVCLTVGLGLDFVWLVVLVCFVFARFAVCRFDCFVVFVMLCYALMLVWLFVTLDLFRGGSVCWLFCLLLRWLDILGCVYILFVLLAALLLCRYFGLLLMSLIDWVFGI